jgi:hypothetical protein
MLGDDAPLTSSGSSPAWMASVCGPTSFGSLLTIIPLLGERPILRQRM